jgi:nucleotide-binding universal stress UspA family protein
LRIEGAPVINPLRSEEDAFRFTVVVAVLVAPIALAAIFVSSTAALVVAIGVVVGVIVGLFVLKRDEPEPRTMLGRPSGDDRRRILVVANETLHGEALRAEIAHRSRGAESEVRVVCPALNTKIKHWVSDEDNARRQAQERLDTVLAQLRRQGLQVEGDIGDGDPVQAMEDALRVFPADEVIISTHPYGRSNWLERNVVERARERFALPVTHVVVDLEHEREFVRESGDRAGST